MSKAVRRNHCKRIIRDPSRSANAAKCIGELSKGCDIFGLTTGDFSKVDILYHCLEATGPAHITIGTWTAARADIETAWRLLELDSFLSVRWFVDRSFPTRQPEYYRYLLGKFGADAIRFARCHMKFLMIRNDDWDILVRTSMNLNMNRRIENFDISEDARLCDCVEAVVSEYFDRPADQKDNLELESIPKQRIVPPWR